MSILIVGSEGSMGKRYQAILNYLSTEWYGIDLHNQDEFKRRAENSSGFIVATPTSTHTEIVRRLFPYGNPILCEKPISKNVKEVKDLLADVQAEKIHFQMMYQYKRLIPEYSRGDSAYDYFRHGKDGLIWDCLQIIGLSDTTPTLNENSPLWKCRINGHTLQSHQMDAAYVSEVGGWLRGHPQDLSPILEAHEKTARLAQHAL